MSLVLLVRAWEQASLETISDFCAPIVRSLKDVGVRVKFDSRVNYTAGWK